MESFLAGPVSGPNSGAGHGPRWNTRGQPAALAAVAGMITGSQAHAVLLVGPAGVGKTTLALDLAAGLLCVAPDPADRPCRSCRGCRQVASGNHPDVHRLEPSGPGGQIVVGDTDDPKRPPGVRDLLHDLSFLPVEGRARVAIIEHASQMNEDAQHALLKTLEEPPPGVTVVLCADDEAALLPTIRSRCAHLRLGTVGTRTVEAILADAGLADAATAARLARIADGRPGIAVAYARKPEAAAVRDEIVRTLLDAADASRSRRLALVRNLVGRAGELADALLGAPVTEAPVRPRRSGRSRGTVAREPVQAGVEDEAGALSEAEATASPGDARRVSPAERRRGARQLIEIWRDLARDLAVAAVGDRAHLRDPALLEELEALAARLPSRAMPEFLERLGAVSDLVAGNANPELALDVLILAWPRPRPTVEST